MLAVLTEAPTNAEGWDRFAFHNRTSHQAINSVLGLVDPVLFPIDQGDWSGWLERHSLLHQQMDQVIGQQSADLSLLDPNDPNQVSLWIAQHWLEHSTVEAALGIAS